MILEHFEDIYKRYRTTIGQIFYNNATYEALKGTADFIELPDNLLLVMDTAFTIENQGNKDPSLTVTFYDTLLAPLKNSRYSKDWHPFLVLAYLNIILEYFDDCDHFAQADKTFDEIERMLLDIYQWLIEQSCHYREYSKHTFKLIFEIPDKLISLDDKATKIEQTKESVYLSIGELSAFKNASDIEEEIIEQIRAKYRRMPAIDGKADTRLGSMARLHHVGADHPQYDIAMTTLECDIFDTIASLPIADLAKLFFDIQEATSDWISDIKDWQTFRKKLLETDDLKDVIHEIQEQFFRYLPTYVGNP